MSGPGPPDRLGFEQVGNEGARRAFEGDARFEILDQLGEGAAGIVYRAHDRERAEEVALKVLKRANDRSRHRFAEEVERTRALEHPNLVRIDHAGELPDGRPYLSMELLEGEDFVDHCRPGALLDEQRLRDTLPQLILAVRALHRARLVHRDLKASNVLVTRQGRVVVLDMGLAEEVRELGTGPTGMAGTLLYCAPEQLTGRGVGPPADWYGLGVMLYETLTGGLPFDGTERQIAEKQERDAVSPGQLAPDLPADLVGLCERLLARDPADRPDSRDALVALGEQDPDVGRLTATALLTTSPDFVGRGQAMEQLNEALERSRSGPLCVQLCGDSGQGKRALADRFARQAVREKQALSFSCQAPRHAGVPFQTVLPLLSQLSQQLPDEEVLAQHPRTGWVALSSLSPGFAHSPANSDGEPADAVEYRFLAFDALRWLCDRIAAERPLIVVVHDWPRVDEDSRQLLQALAQRLSGVPLLLLLVGGEASLPLEGTVSEVVRLPPLSAQESLQLATQLLTQSTGRAPERQARLLAERSGGNPLLLQELLRQRLFFGERAPDRRFHTVADAMLPRIEALPEPARLLLRLMTEAEVPLAKPVLATAAQMEEAEFGRYLQALRVAGFCVGARAGIEGAVSLSHNAVADAVRLAHPAEDRTDAARSLAMAMASHGSASPGALLRLQQVAGLSGQAAHSAEQLAHRAEESLAFGLAADSLRALYSLRPPEGKDGYAEHRRLAVALSHAGRNEEAAEHFARAAQVANTADALEMRRLAAASLIRCGMVDEGCAAVESMLTGVGLKARTTPGRSLASALWGRTVLSVRGFGFKSIQEVDLPASERREVDALWTAGALLGVCTTLQGFDYQTQAVRRALQLGEPWRVARALTVEAQFLIGTEAPPFPKARRLMNAAQSIADELDDPVLRAYLGITETSAAFIGWQLQECVQWGDRSERLVRQLIDDPFFELGMLRTNRLFALAYLGRYEDAAARYARYMRDAQDRGDTFCTTQIDAGFLHWLAIRDDWDARERIEATVDAWSRDGFHVVHFFELMSRFRLWLYFEPEAAWHDVQQQWPPLQKSMMLRIPTILLTMVHLRGACALSRAKAVPSERAALLTETRQAAKRVASLKTVPAQAFASMLRAGAAEVAGRKDEATAQLRQASQHLRAMQPTVWRWCVDYLLGPRLGGDEGTTMRKRGEEAIVAAGVKQPERYVLAHVPGF